MYKSRKAQYRIGIYEAVVVADGYGGNTTTTSTLSGTRWSAVEDVNGNQIQNEAGLKEFNDTYKFTFRYDADLIIQPKKHLLKYGGNYYAILSVKTLGFRQVSQVVTAKKIFDES